MDYHDDHSAVTKSGLTVFARSPLEYYHTYITGKLPRKATTPAMMVGTVLHAALLEGKSIDDLLAVYPRDCFKSNDTLHPQKAAEFRDSIAATAVKQADYDEIATLAGIVTPQLADFLRQPNVQCEAVFRAEDIHGLPAKCKPDAVLIGDAIQVIDLKFCAAVDPASFERSARNFRYWLQDAHYTAVLESLHGNRYVGFEFIAIETKFPYRVQRYHYDIASRDTGRAEHKRLMQALARCHETGDWSDGWDSTLMLSPWDVKSTELVEVES